jgi:hypothetical protein
MPVILIKFTCVGGKYIDGFGALISKKEEDKDEW